MLTYLVKFSRYDAKAGEMRLSGPTWITADSFGDAAEQARMMLRGLKGADPVRDYDIALIDHTRELHRAIDCSAGSHLFETQEELAARVGAVVIG